MKVCVKCKEEKDVSFFSKKKTSRDGIKRSCKGCDSIQNKNIRRTKIGKLKLIYTTQVSHSIKRGDVAPNYSLQDFINRYIDDIDYLNHYYWWMMCGYPKSLSPSFDRKDDYKGYSFDNIQIMYWHQNNAKFKIDMIKGNNKKRLKPIISTNILNGEVTEYYSGADASRKGFNRQCVSMCCLGKLKTHKGHYWRFK